MDWRDDPDFVVRRAPDDKCKVQLELCRKFYEKCKEFGTDGSDEMRQAMSMIGDWEAEIKLGGLGWPVANRERFASAMAACGVGMNLERITNDEPRITDGELQGPRLRAVVCDVMVRVEEWSLAYKAAIKRLRRFEAKKELRITNDDGAAETATAQLPEVRVMKVKSDE